MHISAVLQEPGGRLLVAGSTGGRHPAARHLQQQPGGLPGAPIGVVSPDDLKPCSACHASTEEPATLSMILKPYGLHVMLLLSQVEMKALDELIAQKLPRLSAHLNSLEADVSILATDWFLTLYAASMPSETVSAACRACNLPSQQLPAAWPRQLDHAIASSLDHTHHSIGRLC